jgi:glycerophosphodiester phosphodiesterase
MKFGRNLPQFTVPEWSASYIKYKALKKLIKSAAEQVKAGEEADLAGKSGSLWPQALRHTSEHPSN